MQDEQTPRKPIEQPSARTHSNCHYQWLLEEKFNMMRLGFLTKKQNQRLVFWVGKGNPCQDRSDPYLQQPFS